VQPAEQPLRLVGLVGAVDKADSALKLRGPENAVTVQVSALPTEVGGGDSVTLTDIGGGSRRPRDRHNQSDPCGSADTQCIRPGSRASGRAVSHPSDGGSATRRQCTLKSFAGSVQTCSDR
jgi:hypothetical protein